MEIVEGERRKRLLGRYTYLDLARIFLLLRLSLRIRFFLHFALIWTVYFCKRWIKISYKYRWNYLDISGQLGTETLWQWSWSFHGHFKSIDLENTYIWDKILRVVSTQRFRRRMRTRLVKKRKRQLILRKQLTSARPKK